MFSLVTHHKNPDVPETIQRPSKRPRLESITSSVVHPGFFQGIHPLGQTFLPLSATALSAEEASAPAKRGKRGPSGAEEAPSKKRRRNWKEQAPVIEKTRDAAFGIQQKCEMLEVARKLEENPELLAQLQAQRQQMLAQMRSPLNKKQQEKLEDVAKCQSQEAAALLHDFFLLNLSPKKTQKYPFQIILHFALSVIEQFPRTEIPEEELDPIFIQIAKEQIEDVPPNMPEEFYVEVAKAIQKATKQANGEEEKGVDLLSPSSPLQKHIRLLGLLLFVSEGDPSEAAKCLDQKNLETSFQNILKLAQQRMDQSLERIDKHKSQHLTHPIQSAEEAHFHQLSIEIAALSLLQSGSFNFAIIHDLKNYMIPEQLRSTRSGEEMLKVLERLSFPNEIVGAIEHVSKPQSSTLPSNETIRTCLNLSPDEVITNRHAQITVLSAALGHLRQARAGTCFTTAWLIKSRNSMLESAIEDMSCCIRDGGMVRTVLHETKVFPFQTITTNENLDTCLTVDREGRILKLEKYSNTPEQQEKEKPLDSKNRVWNIPGIQAACTAIDLKDAQAKLHLLFSPYETQRFSIKDLLYKIAEMKFQEQESIRFVRFHQKHSIESLQKTALYAFGSQTNHPLHRAWEASVANMPNYFASKHLMASWVYEALETSLKEINSNESTAFKRKQNKLLTIMYLPMICRMRYLYNHHIGDSEHLVFEDKHLGLHNSHFYGYELYDTGLPQDFSFFEKPIKTRRAKSGYICIAPFRKYLPSQYWSRIHTAEKFQAFMTDVVLESIEEIKRRIQGANYAQEKKEWDDFAQSFCGKIHSPEFSQQMMQNVLGKSRSQKLDLKKNEYTLTSTPWSFKWGGSPNEVMNSLHSRNESPVKDIHYTGDPQSILASHINYVKKMPQSIREEFANPNFQTIVCSPVHAFLLKPNEESFKAAYESEMETEEYIEKYVLSPGLEVARSSLPQEAKRQILDYLANNRWARRSDEKDDLDRQQLSERAKVSFDQMAKAFNFTPTTSVGRLEKDITDAVIKSRASDERVGKRYPHWEQQFKTVFRNKMKDFFPSDSKDAPITQEGVQAAIDFARNRTDTVAFSEKEAGLFLQETAQLSNDLSIQEFRTEVVRIAQEVREKSLGGKDKEWKDTLTPILDNKIFSFLEKSDQEKLRKASIRPHDTNWGSGIHDIYFCFMVNPGTGKIELCREVVDTGSVSFMEQSSWFGKKKGKRWSLPGVYRIYPGQKEYEVAKGVPTEGLAEFL